ncbi:MAG: Z-ring formation inhibitor MciZ [Calditerricola sp.]|nr:Z-ring formation inhibitor MciZ [Calditerricola sp.]
MKITCTSRCLRLVGRAWEIRAALRSLGASNLTVGEFLHRMTTYGRR